jgi:glycosyltransferase involved in cell wall biosynthesis
MLTAPVSVIVPAHNAERFIAEAIQSVQAQTLSVEEIIVVDNDCTDRTPDIARQSGATVIKEAMRGLSIARNAGIRASKCEWVAFLDADDWWAPNKIELQWRAIQEFPEAGLVSCDTYFAKNGSITPRSNQVVQSRWNNFSESLIRGQHCILIPKAPGDMLSRFSPLSPSALIRRHVFPAVGFFNEDLRYNDELECFMRIMARYPLAIVELPLVYCRLHDDNRSRDIEGKQKAYVQMVNLMTKYPERYPPGAGKNEKQKVKEIFHNVERNILRKRESTPS